MNFVISSCFLFFHFILCFMIVFLEDYGIVHALIMDCALFFVFVAVCVQGMVACVLPISCFFCFSLLLSGTL